MNKTAYLVIWVDVLQAGKLIVTGCGIYSEPHPTATAGSTPFAIEEHEADNFATADRELREAIKRNAKFNPVYATLVRLLG